MFMSYVPKFQVKPAALSASHSVYKVFFNTYKSSFLLTGLLRNYSSVGLFEALCKTLSVLAHSQNQTTDICGHDSREILFQDLFDFFRLIGLRFVTAHGPENWKTVDDFLHLLLFMAIEDKCRY